MYNIAIFKRKACGVEAMNILNSQYMCKINNIVF